MTTGAVRMTGWRMDPVIMAYYAAVCGVLSVLAPSFGGLGGRLVVGAVVGLGAAGALPFVRSTLGF